MRISLKLASSFGVMITLVGAVGYFSSGAQRQVERELEYLSRSAIVNLVGAASMEEALAATQINAHEFLRGTHDAQAEPVSDAGLGRLTRRPRDTIETHLDEFQRSLERSQLAQATLRREAGDRATWGETAERSLALLAQLNQEFNDYQAMMRELPSAMEEDPAAAQVLFDERLTPHYRDRMVPQLQELQRNAATDVTRGLRNAERAMARAKAQRNYITLFSLAVALAMGSLIAWSIGRPLAKLTGATANVAKGRLDTRVDIQSHDEIGRLARSFNEMAAGLQTTTVAKTYVDDIISSMQEMLIVTGQQLDIRRVNPAATRQLGFSEAEVVGRPLAEILGEPVDLRDLETGVASPLLEARERLLPTKSQQPLPVWFTASPLRDEEGAFQGIVCVATDISDRKTTEQQLRSSLREQEVLLKEVHHRVKNNLQIISSLLNLQAQATHHPEAARALRDSQSRIHSMALIHEQLYRSDNLDSIDFGEYVRELTAHVSRSVGAAAQNVAVRVDVDPAPLPIDLAIPCGMIINELFTNAMEHAFPEGRGGEIRVGYHGGDRVRELTVCDNGVGLAPADDRGPSESLGLKVVTALADQVGGKLHLKRNGGTQCTIRFGADDVEESAPVDV